MEGQRKRCKSQWRRNIGQSQATCRVRTLRRSSMKGLVVRGLTLEEIWNVDINYVKVTEAKI